MKSKLAAIIGSFDGFHRGHDYLISTFKDECLKKGLESLLITYNFHPKKTLKGSVENFLIEPNYLRLSRLQEKCNIKILEFEKISQMDAKSFFMHLKKEFSNLHKIYIGYDTKFGCDQISDLSVLNSLLPELTFESIPRFDKIDVSSTILREALRSGNLKRFEELCARKYILSGEVIEGKKLGRELGFPTANLKIDPQVLLIPNGVYVGVTIIDSKSYRFVANIGRRPTIDNESAISIEAHLLNFTGDLYGTVLNLTIIRKIREVQKFNSREDLIEQVKKDISSSLSEKI